MATFYLCPVCGNVVLKVEDSGVTPHCCGKEMIELKAKTLDGPMEKHLPVLERIDECKVRVKVGAEPHPMTPEHQVRFVMLETEHGWQMKFLEKDGVMAPRAVVEFYACKDPIVAVYEYCNLHGLWKLDVSEKGKACEVKGKGCCGLK